MAARNQAEDSAMPDQDLPKIDAESAAHLRSPLLMPVIEGHALEDEDISSFLSTKLLAGCGERDWEPEKRLS
jgi:hypothetical protein